MGYMGMISCSVALRPNQFRHSNVTWTLTKLREEVKEASTKIFKSGLLQQLKDYILSVQKDIRDSEELILEEQRLFSGLEERCSPDNRCEPTLFVECYGPRVKSLENICRENDKLLKDITIGLNLYFDHHDSLFLKVMEIHKRNKRVSKDVSRVGGQFYDYLNRINVETTWISLFAKSVEEWFRNSPAVFPFIHDLQKDLFEISEIVEEIELCQQLQDFESQLSALRALFRTWEAALLQSRVYANFIQVKSDFIFQCHHLRSLLLEKGFLAMRFYKIEEFVKERCPELKQLVSELKMEVDSATVSYALKLSSISDDMQRPDTQSYTLKNVDNRLDFSWRDRDYNGRNILPEIRTQGRSECTSVSTTAATDSLYKKHYAAISSIGGKNYQLDDLNIKLSHHHLQDMVAQYYGSIKRKGHNKLLACLEQMERKGVVTESAYNHGDGNLRDFKRYCIQGFDELSLAGFDDACEILEEGTVLIGNFRITKDYFRLGPDDIYDVPPDAVFETTPAGNIISHCVVIVGFGVTPEGISYYHYQNSYGPGWGNGGFGRVTARSLKLLYAANLDRRTWSNSS